MDPEIKKRHAEFVAMYEAKSAELQSKVDAVKGAWFNFTKKRNYADLHAFLESAKPPSHHQKLDPNKLPQRELEVIKRKPRMSEADFGDLRAEVEKEKSLHPAKYVIAWDWFARKEAQARLETAPKLASSSLIPGLIPTQTTANFSPLDIMDKVIAQTGGQNLPTAADLAATVEAQSDRQSIIETSKRSVFVALALNKRVGDSGAGHTRKHPLTRRGRATGAIKPLSC